MVIVSILNSGTVGILSNCGDSCFERRPPEGFHPLRFLPSVRTTTVIGESDIFGKQHLPMLLQETIESVPFNEHRLQSYFGGCKVSNYAGPWVLAMNTHVKMYDTTYATFRTGFLSLTASQ